VAGLLLAACPESNLYPDWQMSRLLKVLVGVAALGVVAVAFRDTARGRWLRPALPGGGDEGDLLIADGEEPVLGFDGMDRDTLLDWLADADLDRDTLLRIRAYESANLARESVLDAVDDLLD
jgi:hypothetical protein